MLGSISQTVLGSDLTLVFSLVSTTLVMQRLTNVMRLVCDPICNWCNPAQGGESPSLNWLNFGSLQGFLRYLQLPIPVSRHCLCCFYLVRTLSLTASFALLDSSCHLQLALKTEHCRFRLAVNSFKILFTWHQQRILFSELTVWFASFQT